jgi:hypothetical protein
MAGRGAATPVRRQQKRKGIDEILTFDQSKKHILKPRPILREPPFKPPLISSFVPHP